MSEAKPYTTERQWLDQPHEDRVVATVRALAAARAEVTALRARVAELERGTNLVTTDTERRLLADLAARDARVAELEKTLDKETRESVDWERSFNETADERDKWKAKAEELEASGIAFAKEATVALEVRMSESDEWKARAEAAEKVRGELVQLAATAEVQRDEAAALAERLRDALTAVGDDVGVMQTSRHDDAIDTCAQHALGIIDAALATPAPAWLRERDRALAMRVAEAAYAQGHADGRGRPNPAVCAAIVDKILKEKP